MIAYFCLFVNSFLEVLFGDAKYAKCYGSIYAEWDTPFGYVACISPNVRVEQGITSEERPKK